MKDCPNCDRMRDWFSHNITLKKGLCGAKPPKLCEWAFEVSGLEPQDEFHDLYPGTGIVLATWNAWAGELKKPAA